GTVFGADPKVPAMPKVPAPKATGASSKLPLKVPSVPTIPTVPKPGAAAAVSDKAPGPVSKASIPLPSPAKAASISPKSLSGGAVSHDDDIAEPHEDFGGWDNLSDVDLVPLGGGDF